MDPVFVHVYNVNATASTKISVQWAEIEAPLAKGSKPRLVIDGQEGQLYRIEVSADLRQWKVLKLIEGAAKPVEFVDELGTTELDTFYRTVTP